VPGYVPGFLQPIENRILMLSTGIRAQVGIKILGDNLDALQPQGLRGRARRPQMSRRTGVAPSRVQGKPYLDISVNREAMARYGCARDVLDVVETGIGGEERHHRPSRAAALSHPGAHGSATSATTSSGSAICSCHARRENTSRSARSPTSARDRPRAKSPARTAACASSCRPTCRAATSAASWRTQGAHRAAKSAAAGHDHRMERPVRKPAPRQAHAAAHRPRRALFIIFLLLYIVYHSPPRKRRTSSSPCRSR
jgi:hypothetical protein